MTVTVKNGQDLTTKEEVLRATERPASIESVARQTGKCRPNVRKHLIQLVKEGKVLEVQLGNCRVFQRVYYKGEKIPDPETVGYQPLTEEGILGCDE